MSHSILIYEDNPQLRESIEGLLSLHEDFSVVGAFENSRDILRHLRTLHPDLILMDIDMGVCGGVQAVRLIRQEKSTIPVIMLTVFDDNENIFNALHAGANGYLLKKHASERLIPAVYDVLHGGAPMSPDIARRVLQSFHEQPAFDYRLTPREQEILASMSLGNSYKIIAAGLGISIDTVRVHIKHIYEKLHVNSQTEAVSKAFREKLL